MVVKMKLILSNLKARDLMDTGTMFDPQDPSLHIKLGEIHQLTTERIQDARSNADFDETFETEVSIDDYNKGIDVRYKS